MASNEWYIRNVSMETRLKIKRFALDNGDIDLGVALERIMERLEKLEEMAQERKASSK